MDITVSQAKGRVPVTIFRLAGSLDGLTYEDLINSGIEAQAAGTTDLLLDMRKLDFMSSAGMVALQMLLRLMGSESAPRGKSAQRAHLKLLGPSPDVLRVLEVAGLKDYFEIYADEAQAIKSFQAA